MSGPPKEVTRIQIGNSKPTVRLSGLVMAMVLGALSASEWLSGSQGGEGEPTAADLVLEYDAQIEELEGQLRADPRDPDTPRRLVMVKLSRWELDRHLTGAPPTNEERTQQVQRLAREWVDLQPWNQHAYFYLLSQEPNPEVRAEGFVDLTRKFPASADAYRKAYSALRMIGDMDRREELAERFVAEHPEVADAFAISYQHFEAKGNGVRASQILDEWLSRHPGDATALLLWFSKVAAEGSEVERVRQLATGVIDSLAAGPRAHAVCRKIGSVLKGAAADLAIECYEKMLSDEESPSSRETLVQELAQLQGTTLGVERIQQHLDRLSPQRRDSVLRTLAVSEAHKGHCSEAVQLLESIQSTGDLGGPMAFVASRCGEAPPLESRLLSLTGALDNDGLIGMAHAWSRTPWDGLEAALLARLEEVPREARLWAALSRYYDITEQLERRIDLLRVQAQSSAAYGLPPKVHVELLDVLWQEGRFDEAIRVADGIMAGEAASESPRVLERVAGLYLDLGNLEQAEAAVRRIEAGLEPTRTYPRTDLLGARIALARGELEQSLAAYRRYLVAATGDEEALAEYAYLAMAVRSEAEVPRLLEEQYESLRAAGRVSVNLDAWVGEKLFTLGHYEEALPYFEAVLTSNSDLAEIHLKVAQIVALLDGAGAAEASLQEYLALDPSDVGRWQKLAEYQLGSERPADARATIEQALARLDKKPFQLRLLLAKAYLAEGALVEGIRELRALVDQYPLMRGVEDLLSQAYVSLGQMETDAKRE